MNRLTVFIRCHIAISIASIASAGSANSCVAGPAHTVSRRIVAAI